MIKITFIDVICWAVADFIMFLFNIVLLQDYLRRQKKKLKIMESKISKEKTKWEKN